jgi:nucleotide-binding universal stress UspA family protein
MYQNLLVPYDDSEFSRAALLEAAHWARRHQGKLTILHAVFFDTEEFGIAPELREKRWGKGRAFTSAAKDRLTSDLGIDAEILYREGDPPEEVLAAAEGTGADLIVMGTHGRRGLSRLLMGSVTSHVIVRSAVDVLAVKKPCSSCRGAYSSLLVPFDASVQSRRSLERACALAKQDSATVTITYVIPRYEEMLDFMRTPMIEKSLRGEAMRILGKGQALADTLGCEVKTLIAEGHGGDEIARAVVKDGHDLVVMGTSGWRGVDKALLGSTAERVIRDAPCPVLVVKQS